MDKSLKNIDDAYKWSRETVEALRAGDFTRIDMDELINEIGSIASGLRRETVAILTEIVEALLVLKYDSSNKDQAERQLAQAQGQLQLLLHSAPSLSEAVPEVLEKAYQRARANVLEDYGVEGPETNPFALEVITEDPYERLMAEGKLA